MTLVKQILGWGIGRVWAGTKIPMTKVSNSERGGVHPPRPPRSASECIDKHVLHPVLFYIFSKWDQFYGIHDYPTSTVNGTLYYF